MQENDVPGYKLVNDRKNPGALAKEIAMVTVRVVNAAGWPLRPAASGLTIVEV